MPDPTPTEDAPTGHTDAAIALAWHDVTCPESRDCRDRWQHALGQPVVASGVLLRFMAALNAPRGVLQLDPPRPVALGDREAGYAAVRRFEADGNLPFAEMPLVWKAVETFADATLGPDPATVPDSAPADAAE